jgi:predicted permease
LESVVADIRFALRWLRKSPAFTLVAVASLAIGIGFNTALFTIVDALLFKPLPVRAPERLVDIFTGARATSFSTSSYPDYVDIKAQNDVFEDVVGYTPMFAALNLDTRSRLVMGEVVTGNYFTVLGVGAAMGRTILPADDRADAPRVAMISHRYWVGELGSAPDVVGRTLRIRGNPYTIVGVAPSRFTGMVPVLSPELWIPVSASLEVEPLGIHDTTPSPIGATRLERRGDRWMFLRARLNPEKTLAEADANLKLVMARLAAENPQTNKDRLLSVRSTNDVHFHPAADATILPIAGGLMAVVGLVLLIACANVASMLLARASGRQREIGIRLALGAGTGQVRAMVISQGMRLALAGVVVGIAAAFALARFISSFLYGVQQWDPLVFIGTPVVLTLVALLATWIPARRASLVDPIDALRYE